MYSDSNSDCQKMESTEQYNSGNFVNNINANAINANNINQLNNNMQAIPVMMYPQIIYLTPPLINPNFLMNQNPQGFSYIAIPPLVNPNFMMSQNPQGLSDISNPQIPLQMNIPNNNLSLNNNSIQVNNNNEQEKIKKNEIQIKMREDFLAILNHDYSFDLLFDRYPEKYQEFFDFKINTAFERYEEELNKDYITDKIYLKKINKKYEFDFYKFENYNNEVDYDLINEYLKENSDNDEINIISRKMKTECISNKNIKLFIYNELCFLSPYTVSVYIPHILKVTHKNTFLTNNLKNKDLEISDFFIEDINNENSLFINILKIRLEDLKKNNHLNGIEFGLDINIKGDRGFLYTTVPIELIEQSILKFDLNNFETQNVIGYNSEKTSLIKKSLINCNKEENINFFKQNEDYLSRMSTQELILFFIIHELKEYIKLPSLIIYENLMDLKENKIYYMSKNLSFIEFDSIIQSKNNFVYNNKFPLTLQNFFEIENNSINERNINNDSYFTIEKDNVYFFEIENSLNLENIGEFLSDIINRFQIFFNI